jgi:LysM repeat protein
LTLQTIFKKYQQVLNFYLLSVNFSITIAAVKTPTLIFGLVMLISTSISGAATHVVKAGDNMYRIALNYGVSLSQLQRANPGVNAHSMRIGQKLTIPLKAAGPIAKSSPSARVTGTYSIASGDTLSSIARRQGTSVAALQAANPSLNPNAMPVGKKINLTGSRSASIASQPAPKAAVAKAPAAPKPAPRPQEIAALPKPSTTSHTSPSTTNAEMNPLMQHQASAVTQPAPAPSIAKNESQALPSPTPIPATISETSTPNTPPSMTGTTPTPVLNSSTQAAPPIPDKADDLAPKLPVGYRLLKTTRELTLDEVAKEYGTTPEKLISLNGWQVNNFNGATLLAVDSELIVPAQP